MSEFRKNKKQKYFTKKKGFSLIELLIVLLILTMGIGMTLVSYRDATKIDKVESAARKVAVAIREAQNNSLTGREIESGGTLIPVCSHGVRWVEASNDTIISSFYTLKTDCNTPQPITSRNIVYDANSDVRISSASQSVYFTIPSGTEKVGGYTALTTADPSAPVSIKIESRSNPTNVYAYVCVYASGLVKEVIGQNCP